MYSSLYFCLKKRAKYLNNPEGWAWVLQDPVVYIFSPALFLLEQAGYINLTEHTREKSKGFYWQAVANYVRQENNIKDFLSNLMGENIEFIPLKGAALQGTIYTKIGLRSMADIDILVQDDMYLPAAKILIENGLQPKWTSESGDPFEFTNLPRKFWPGELSFYDGKMLHLDLHRDLVTYHWFKTAYPLDIDSVWDRRIQIKEQDSSNVSNLWNTLLCPYDMLAHMCLHLALHGLQILKNLWDVDLFLQQLPENWDWQLYLNTAEAWQIQSASYHVFLFCQQIFDTPIPENVMRTLRSGKFDRWQVKRLISHETFMGNIQTLGKRYPTLVKFALFDNSSVKLNTLRQLLFPEQSILNQSGEKITLPDHWSHIMHVLRRGD